MVNNMSQFIEVEIKISDLVHDLRAGLTWFASEDKGHGSIQAKYEMEDEDIIDIQGHPAFNQPIRTFKIVDDYTKKPAKKAETPEIPVATEAEAVEHAIEEQQVSMVSAALDQAEPSESVTNSLFGLPTEDPSDVEETPAPVAESVSPLEFMSL